MSRLIGGAGESGVVGRVARPGAEGAVGPDRGLDRGRGVEAEWRAVLSRFLGRGDASGAGGAVVAEGLAGVGEPIESAEAEAEEREGDERDEGAVEGDGAGRAATSGREARSDGPGLPIEPARAGAQRLAESTGEEGAGSGAGRERRRARFDRAGAEASGESGAIESERGDGPSGGRSLRGRAEHAGENGAGAKGDGHRGADGEGRGAGGSTSAAAVLGPPGVPLGARAAGGVDGLGGGRVGGVSAVLRVQGIEGLGRLSGAGAEAKNGANIAEKTGPSARAGRAEEIEPRAVVSRVSKGLAELLVNGGGRTTLRLSPEALGEVRVELRVSEGAVTAEVIASDEVARALLEAGANELRSALEARGLRVERLEISRAEPEAGPEDQRGEGRGGDEAAGGGEESSAWAGGDPGGDGPGWSARDGAGRWAEPWRGAVEPVAGADEAGADGAGSSGDEARVYDVRLNVVT